MGLMGSTVVATLVADIKEYSAKMDEATGKMEEFGAVSKESSGKFAGFANKASTAILGATAAFAGIALDKAYKFQEGLDAIKNQSTATAAQVNALGQAILNISSASTSTTTDLETAGLTIYQAGIKGAQAITTLRDAAKAAAITGTNVTDVTTALVKVEALHFSQAKDITKVTGELVAASKDYVGGLTQEASVLGGKVGVALRNYGLSLKSAASLGAVFAKVGLPTRSVASFVNGLGKLVAPLMTIHTTSKGSYQTLSTYATTLNQVGLSQTKLAADLRAGNIAGLLMQIKDAAGGSTTKMAELMNVVFGSSAGGVAHLLVNSLGTIKQVTDQINKGSQGGYLQGQFSQVMKQIGPQLKQLMNQVDVLFIRAGKFLLPAVTDIVRWVNDFAKAVKDNPILRDALGIGGATLFAAALGVKLKKVVQSIMGLFNKSTSQVQQTSQVNFLEQIAGNTERIAANTQTTATAAETSAGEQGTADTELATIAGEGGVSAAEGGGRLGGIVTGPLGKAVGLAAAGVLAFEGTTEVLKHNLFGLGTAVNTVAGWLGVTSRQGTTQEAGALAAAMRKYGIQPGVATVALSPATIRFMEGLSNRNSGGRHHRGRTVRVTSTVQGKIRR